MLLHDMPDRALSAHICAGNIDAGGMDWSD